MEREGPGIRTRTSTPQDDDGDASTLPSPPRRSARISLTQMDHVRYDKRYHPMDDLIRRSNAARCRREYGVALNDAETAVVDDSDDTVEAQNRDNDDEDEDARDDDDDDEDDEPDASRSPKPERSSMKGVRVSDRIARQSPPISYSQKVHPQDSQLRSAGVIGRARKRSSTTDVQTQSKRTNKKPKLRGPKSAKTEDMTIEEYVEAYADAWESLGETEAQRRLRVLAKDYLNAWESLGTQQRPAMETPDASSASPARSRSMLPASPLSIDHDIELLPWLPEFGERLQPASNLASTPSTLRNSSKKSQEQTAKERNFEIREDTSSPSSRSPKPMTDVSTRQDEDRENDIDEDEDEDGGPQIPRRRQLSAFNSRAVIAPQRPSQQPRLSTTRNAPPALDLFMSGALVTELYRQIVPSPSTEPPSAEHEKFPSVSPPSRSRQAADAATVNPQRLTRTSPSTTRRGAARPTVVIVQSSPHSSELYTLRGESPEL